MNKQIIFTLTILFSFVTLSVSAHNTEKQEVLYGVTFFENSLEIIVKSNGCTKAQDFRLDKLYGEDHTLLNVVRLKTDKCRRMPKPIRISLPLKVKQQKHFKINNSFAVNDKLRK